MTLGTAGGPAAIAGAPTPATTTLTPAFACAISAFTAAPLRPRAGTKMLY
jgi:hypothetical protein